MPARRPISSLAGARLGAEAVRLCATRAARVTGIHALLLDGSATLASRWSVGPGCAIPLSPVDGVSAWRGPLHAELTDLPFVDGAFSVVCVWFPGGDAARPEAVAGELARVLAVHGVLLVADVHPFGLWRVPASSPWRWRQALRRTGLEVGAVTRFGAPWPRVRGTDGLPRWLVGALGGGWLLAARRPPEAGATVIRPAFAARRVREPATTLLPGAGAHRQCA
jgi:hypothetical protein